MVLTCRTSQRNANAMGDNWEICDISGVLIFRTLLIQARNLVQKSMRRDVEKMKGVYRIAHPVAEVHASITESDSSERRCQPSELKHVRHNVKTSKNDCTAFVCELHYRLGSLRCGASVQLLFSVPIVRKYQQQDCCLGMLVAELG
jgi:hypothetical protein